MHNKACDHRSRSLAALPGLPIPRLSTQQSSLHASFLFYFPCSWSLSLFLRAIHKRMNTGTRARADKHFTSRVTRTHHGSNKMAPSSQDKEQPHHKSNTLQKRIAFLDCRAKTAWRAKYAFILGRYQKGEMWQHNNTREHKHWQT